jgi:hypothetical protein
MSRVHAPFGGFPVSRPRPRGRGREDGSLAVRTAARVPVPSAPGSIRDESKNVRIVLIEGNATATRADRLYDVNVVTLTRGKRMTPDVKDADRLSPFRDAGETRKRVCDAVRGALHIKSAIGISVTWDAFRPRRAWRRAPFEAQKKNPSVVLSPRPALFVTASSTSP